MTRHNYEEYFILYLDNELSREERLQVEAFVQLHPDLKEELDLLLNYKLVPDTTIQYTGKNELLKTASASGKEFGTNPVTLTNYEEWFTSYIDHELTDDERLNVEQFVAQNPSLEKEFSLLQKTKLQPEKIVFADKASLYRKEENVYLLTRTWWRVAAAAILILGISFATYSIITKNSPAARNGTEIANAADQKNNTETPVSIQKKENTSAESTLANKDVQKNNETLPDQIKGEKDIQSSPAIVTSNKKDLNAEKKNTVSPVLLKKEEPVIVDNKQPSNNLPRPENNPNLKMPFQNDAVAINDINKGNVNPVTSIGNDVTNKTPLPSNIRQASFKDDAIFDQDDKKNKLRGFFRKITRTLEKRTDIDATDDDGKLLVAGLAIKLK